MKIAAARLFAFAVSAFEQEGYQDVYLWTLEENIRALRFYEKHGFRRDGASMKIAVGGKDLTEVRYVKNILTL